MLLLSQIREELALYFELIGSPKTATEKAIRDRIITLHNELVKIEVVAAVVPVADLETVVSAFEKTTDSDSLPPPSFTATIKAINELIESRKPKAETAPVEVVPSVPASADTAKPVQAAN
jgi:hypothetical protein